MVAVTEGAPDAVVSNAFKLPFMLLLGVIGKKFGSWWYTDQLWNDKRTNDKNQKSITPERHRYFESDKRQNFRIDKHRNNVTLARETSEAIYVYTKMNNI